MNEEMSRCQNCQALFPSTDRLCPLCGYDNLSLPVQADKPIDRTKPEQLIWGTWDWAYTQLIGRGINPPEGRTTPESKGHTEQRRFLANGHVEVYRDRKLIGTYRYWVEQWEDSRVKEPIYSIRMHGVGKQMRVSEDQLIIGSGERCGSRVEYYTRIKEIA